MADVFITDDAVLVRGVGFLDPTDLSVMKGKAVRSTVWMAIQDQSRFETPNEQEGARAAPGYIWLNQDRFEELRDAADRTYDIYTARLEPVLLSLPALCKKIRDKRVTERYSWRAIARWAFYRPELRQVPWSPPESQPVGFVLCDLAAATFDEEHMVPPWNDLPSVEEQGDVG